MLSLWADAALTSSKQRGALARQRDNRCHQTHAGHRNRLIGFCTLQVRAVHYYHEQTPVARHAHG